MVGDVDVVQLDHHGSTTANNQTFLSALKAEVAFAADRRDQHVRPPEPRDGQQVPEHAVDTAATASPAPACRRPAPGPVFYQNEASPPATIA